MEFALTNSPLREKYFSRGACCSAHVSRARNVPAKNDSDSLRACGRELCEAFERVWGCGWAELDFSAFLNYNPDIDRVICALSAGAKAPREADGNSALSQ